MTWPIVELRQYTTQPGQRDAFIELFEREFVDSQDTLGMKILGLFRDEDRADRFVWLRGFSDMSARARQLEAFYTGPVWQAHRNAANAKISDSDNVLLLHETAVGRGLRPAADVSRLPGGYVVVVIYPLRDGVASEAIDLFETHVRARVQAAGLPILGTFATETAPNTFPRLPVREHDAVFAWFTRADNPDDYQRRWGLVSQTAWWEETRSAWQRIMRAPPELLHLQPTARSPLK